jgi:Signal transduction histidine kinase
MPIQFHFLYDPTLLLQVVALALSIFNLIAFLWLACTVWLNGDRRSAITRIGAVGLGMSALFFFVHALLIFGPLEQPSGIIHKNFFWHLIWLPALGVPYIWFVIGLYYASQFNAKWRARRPLLLLCSAALGISVLLLLMLNHTTQTFRGTILLLTYGNISSYNDTEMHLQLFSPLVLLPILFLFYVTFCAIGPWFTPNRIRRFFSTLWLFLTRRIHPLSLRRTLVDAFWNDHWQTDQLEEPMLSWHLARPVLLLAALMMVCLTVSLAILGVWSMLRWLEVTPRSAATMAAAATLNTIPVSLVLLDLYATGCVALIVLLIGYSILRHGILIERPLARRGFFEQWRGVVVTATLLALLISLLVMVSQGSLASMLLISSLTIGTYALFTWSSYTAHDRYNALLKPFLRSTSVRHWLNTDLHKTEQGMEALFTHLCQDVLEVSCARLVVLAGPVRRSFAYRWTQIKISDDYELHATGDIALTDIKRGLAQEQATNLRKSAARTDFHMYRIRGVRKGIPIICWVLPLYDELGMVARLYLGPRKDGVVFTNEDMELAQACGQRILDTLRDHEAMLAVAGLLRRQIVDVKLLGAQQRRVLHDEILPQLHLALLRLETARSYNAQLAQAEPEAQAGQISGSQERAEQSLNEAILSISATHRQLASMMRAMSTGTPHRLELDGMMHAIHTMLMYDFQHSFDEVEWNVSEETMTAIDDLVPPAIAELIFAAVQEALRNAARHARGTDVHRRLRLRITAACSPDLEVVVEDDGIGITGQTSATTGTGGGLLTHSALLAIAGGSVTVKSSPGEGVSVRIFLPIEALR